MKSTRSYRHATGASSRRVIEGSKVSDDVGVAYMLLSAFGRYCCGTREGPWPPRGAHKSLRSSNEKKREKRRIAELHYQVSRIQDDGEDGRTSNTSCSSAVKPQILGLCLVGCRERDRQRTESMVHISK